MSDTGTVRTAFDEVQHGLQSLQDGELFWSLLRLEQAALER